MGFEMVFTAPQLTYAQWQKALSCVEKQGQFEVVERAAGEYPSVAYLYEVAHMKAWPEDFTVAMQPPGVYLLLHSATSQQQAYVTTLLTECLHQAGISGAFEEL